MNSKEKAKELVNLLHNGVRNRHQRDYSLVTAKKSALICVENEYYQLREQLIHFRATRIIEDEKFYLKYLQKLIDEENEVKQEIQKL